MSATLRNLIKSAWMIAHPDAPVYVGDPATPEDSFLASPLDYANLEAETSKSYPMCLVWRIQRMPAFTGSGHIENSYKVFLFVCDLFKPADKLSVIQGKIDALRDPVDKMLSVLHQVNSQNGITEVNVEDMIGQLDDSLCGHSVSFKIWIDEESETLCEAPELIEP